MINKQFRNLRQVRLTPAEKNRVKTQLVDFMTATPVRKSWSTGRIWHESFKSFVDSWLISNHTKNMVASILIALLLAVGGGTSLAAEGALPGDTLYPIKVNVNENIRAALAISDESEAEWNTEVVARRLQEAEQLAAVNKLDSQTATMISIEVKDHSQKVKQVSDSLSDQDQAETAAWLNSILEAKIKAHANVLSALGQGDNLSDDLINLLDEVSVELGSATEARIKIENKVSNQSSAMVQTAAAGRIKAAETKLTEAKKYLAEKKSRISEKIVVQAETKISQAEQTLNEAKGKMAEKSLGDEKYRQAYTLALKSFRLSQEAKSLLTSGQRLKIERGINFDFSTSSRNRSNDGNDDSDDDNSQREEKLLEIKSKIELSDDEIEIEIESELEDDDLFDDHGGDRDNQDDDESNRDRERDDD